VFFLIFLISSINYILSRLRDISKRLERLENNPTAGQGKGHLIEDPTRKKKDELFKRILTGSQ
jgi:hypothetical protein